MLGLTGHGGTGGPFTHGSPKKLCEESQRKTNSERKLPESSSLCVDQQPQMGRLRRHWQKGRAGFSVGSSSPARQGPLPTARTVMRRPAWANWRHNMATLLGPVRAVGKD